MISTPLFEEGSAPKVENEYEPFFSFFICA